MKINRIEVGYLVCNCYVLEIDNKVLVIDPGDEYDKIKPYLKDKKVLGIILTHRHFDHIGSIDDIVRDYNVKVYDNNNLEEKEYKIDKFTFNIIKTPGHTMDSICIYFKKDKIMFTGDFIFKGSIGRCDLGGDIDLMNKSIDKIKKYNDDIIIYPGHGGSSSLGYEKEYNMYFR